VGSEMGPLGSPGMTSYRLPIVIIGPSLTVFALLRVFQTDRQTDGRTDGRMDTKDSVYDDVIIAHGSCHRRGELVIGLHEITLTFKQLSLIDVWHMMIAEDPCHVS